MKVDLKKEDIREESKCIFNKIEKMTSSRIGKIVIKNILLGIGLYLFCVLAYSFVTYSVPLFDIGEWHFFARLFYLVIFFIGFLFTL